MRKMAIASIVALVGALFSFSGVGLADEPENGDRTSIRISQISISGGSSSTSVQVIQQKCVIDGEERDPAPTCRGEGDTGCLSFREGNCECCLECEKLGELCRERFPDLNIVCENCTECRVCWCHCCDEACQEQLRQRTKERQEGFKESRLKSAALRLGERPSPPKPDLRKPYQLQEELQIFQADMKEWLRQRPTLSQ